MSESLQSSPRRRRSVELAIFVLVVVAVGPFMHRMGEQQASRYALTAAIWDEGTLSIDSYDHLLRRDRAVVDGVTYSDKAPGQPVVAVPFYGIYRMAGGMSAADQDLDSDNYGLWWVTLWTATVPLGVIAVVLYRWVSRTAPRTAVAAPLGIVFGTLLLPYGALLFGHVLAALFLLGAFVLIRRADSGPWKLVAAGALCGAGVMTEYPVALIVGVLVLAAVSVHRSKAGWLMVGGLPFVLLLLAYNIAAFGGPLTFSYQWSAFSDVADQARPTFGIFSGFSMSQLGAVLFSQRGLFVATPVTAMALLGSMYFRRSVERVDMAVAAAALVVMVALAAFWANPYAGGPGPRYVTPALPFLAAPVAALWERWRFLVRLAVAVSCLTMILAVLTEPQLGSGFPAGLAFWLQWAVDGGVADSIYNVSFGHAGDLLHLGTVVTAVVWVSVAAHSRFESRFAEAPSSGWSA